MINLFEAMEIVYFIGLPISLLLEVEIYLGQMLRLLAPLFSLFQPSSEIRMLVESPLVLQMVHSPTVSYPET